MIPVGYMFKTVSPRPDWLKAAGVADIYSLSGCVSEYFTDYINFWKHNGYWLFDSPAIIRDIAANIGLDLSQMTLFYYEAFDEEFDGGARRWTRFYPEKSFPTNVAPPAEARLEGYDVTTFSGHTNPECSPLSCNSLAERISINRHCLFESFDEAKAALESGKFDNTEPGPHRIFAVYTVKSAVK